MSFRKIRRPRTGRVRDARQSRFEQLESRQLLANANLFAVLEGELVGAGDSQEFEIAIRPEDFTLTGGKTLLGFGVRAGAESGMDPAAVSIRDANDVPVAVRFAAADVPGSSQSLAVAELSFGTYRITVRAEGDTFGAYQLECTLVGDVNGDRHVDIDDGTIIRSRFGAISTSPNYLAEADINADGIITSFDYAGWRTNLDDATSLERLSLDAAILPQPLQLPDGTIFTNTADVQVTGVTLPGVAVTLEAGDDDGFDEGSVVGDNDGGFSLPVTLAEGPNVLRVRAADGFGQIREQVLPVTLYSLEPSPNAISQISPANGETLVNVAREVIVRFDHEIDPTAVTQDSFHVIANGMRLPGTIRVSSTERFATFFPASPLPPSTEVRIFVDGNAIIGRDGVPVDADRDGTPGGVAVADFRTLPLTRIPGTNVSGRVVDAYNKNPDGSDIPIVGATIRVDGFPEASVLTDANGQYTLVDMPAPDFFVHVDGTTATNAPPGVMFPSVGKAFHSIPGQSVVMPFNIHLPPMALGDIAPLAAGQSTDVGFGAAGKAQLAEMFPEIDPEMWELVRVTFAAGTAYDDQGNVATEAVVIPVPPDRLPAPLPADQSPSLVISIQPLGATNFDTPAPVAFPNVDGLAVGEQTLIWSFNHDAGRWEVVGTGTVSAGGMTIVSDPGMGILAPGWHFTDPGGCGGSGGAPPLVVPGSQSVANLVTEDSIALALITGEVGSFPTLTFLPPGPQSPPPLIGLPGCDVPLHGSTEGKATLTVTIDIDGPLDQFMKMRDGTTEAVSSNSFTLVEGSGEQRSFGVDALSFLEVTQKLGVPGTADYPLSQLNENVLFGAKIKITELTTNADGTMDTRITNYFLYRYVDATDANHTDAVIEFEDTFMGVTRAKPLQMKIGASATPNLFVVSQPFDLSGDSLTFTPTSAGPNQSTQLFVQTPTGDLAGLLTMLGAGVGPQKFYIDFNTSRPENLVAQLKDLFDRNIILPNEKAFFGDPDGTGGFIFSAVKAEAFGNLVAQKVRDNLAPFGTATKYVTAADAETVDMNSFVDIEGRPDAVAATDFSDYQNGEFNAEDLLKNRARYSAAEQNFRLSKTLNANAHGQVSLYLFRTFNNKHKSVGGTPYATIGEIVHELGRTLAHEFGHAVGMPHANKQKDGRFDYMYQGHVIADSPTWNISANAMRVALGLPFTLEEGQQAVTYVTVGYKLDNRQNQNDEAVPGGFDPNTGEVVVFDSGLLGVFEATEEDYRDAVDFSTINVGAGAVSIPLRLVNLGDQPTTINAVEIAGSGAFHVSGLTGGQVIDPDAAINFLVTFEPAATGFDRALLRVVSDGLQPETVLALQGTGVRPEPTAAVTALDNNLGGVPVSSGVATTDRLATITNHGLAPLMIHDVQLDTESAAFTLTHLPDFSSRPVTLAFGESFTFGATFDPIATGIDRALIDVVTNDPSQLIKRITAIGTGLDSVVYPEWGEDYFALSATSDTSRPVLRTVSNLVGDFTFALPPQQDYHMQAFDPETGLVAHSYGTTPRSGQGLDLTSSLTFRASTAPDRDFDGLPDDVEFTIGINADSADTDNDGIDDFAEIQQGLNPFSGGLFPTGVISSLPLLGPAQSVTVEGNIAFVATGPYGLALVDSTDFQLPIVLGQLDLDGVAVDVGVDVARSVAVVADTTALHLVDISDPMLPSLRQTLNIDATQVEVIEGVAYAAEGRDIVAVDILTGEILQRLNVATIDSVAALASDGTTLYAHLGLEQRFILIDAAQRGAMQIVGNIGLDISTGSPSIAVGGGAAFVVANGIWAVDVTNPAAPILLRNADSFFSARGGSLNGSGLMTVASLTEGLRLFDVSDPLTAPVFVNQFSMLGVARQVQNASGIAFVAGDTAGLVTINYLPFDAQGSPPTVSIASATIDLDPGAPGVQVVEGSPLLVDIDVSDDVQVRQVELIVGGQVVRTDVSFPFRFEAIAPPLGNASGRVDLQVRATDTGGNQSLSNILMYISSSDMFAPVVVGTLPLAGGRSSLRSLSVSFNEAIDPALVGASGISLTWLGGDNMPGGGDDAAVTGFGLELRDGDRTLVVYPPMGINAGVYQLTVSPSIVADVAGNHLAAPFSLLAEKRGTLSPIALGETVSDEILEQGEIHSYAFNGTAGQRIYVDGLLDNSDEGIFIRLERPDSQEVYNFVRVTFDNGPVTLPQTGAYKIEIGADNGPLTSDQGAYSFRVLDADVAPEIFLDQQVDGTIDPRSGAVLFRFAGAVGQEVFFDSIAGGIGGGWRLLDPSNNSLSSTNLQNDFLVTLPTDGTYVLALTGNDNSAAPIPFSFKAVTPKMDSGQIDFDEIVSDELALPEDSFVYTFEGVADTRIFFDALMNGGGAGISVLIESPDGTDLQSISRVDRDSNAPVTLTQTGTHTITIGGGSSNGVGFFAFRLLNASAAPLLTIDRPPAVDAIDQPFGATFFRFNGTSDQRLLFDALDAGADGWTVLNSDWEVFRPNNQIINGDLPQLDFGATLPQTGEYLLIVLENNGNPTVNFQFQVLNQQIVNKGELSFGQTFSGMLTAPAEAHEYTFNGIAGQRIWIDALHANDGPRTETRLFDPAGAQINVKFNAGSDMGLLSLSSTGVYSFVIGNGSGELTDYEYRLIDVADAPIAPLGAAIMETLDPPNRAVFFQFNASSGQMLDYDNALSVFATNVTLFGPSGFSVRSGSAETDFSQPLSETGTYLLVFTNNNLFVVDPIDIEFQITLTLPAVVLTTPMPGDFDSSGTVGPGDSSLRRADSGQRVAVGAGADLATRRDALEKFATGSSGTDGSGNSAVDQGDYAGRSAHFVMTLPEPVAGSGGARKAISAKAIQIGRQIVPLSTVSPPAPAETISAAARAVSFALLETTYRWQDSGARSRTRMGQFRIAESGGDDLLALVIDRVWRSPHKDLPATGDREGHDQYIDDNDNQSQVHEPLAAAIASGNERIGS